MFKSRRPSPWIKAHPYCLVLLDASRELPAGVDTIPSLLCSPPPRGELPARHALLAPKTPRATRPSPTQPPAAAPGPVHRHGNPHCATMPPHLTHRSIYRVFDGHPAMHSDSLVEHGDDVSLGSHRPALSLLQCTPAVLQYISTPAIRLGLWCGAGVQCSWIWHAVQCAPDSWSGVVLFAARLPRGVHFYSASRELHINPCVYSLQFFLKFSFDGFAADGKTSQKKK